MNPFECPPGESRAKFTFLLWKRYFEAGYSITGYFKYLIALFGISSLNIRVTLAFGVVYGLICFLVGYIWYHGDFTRLDTEISNKFNDFVKEMRERLGIK